MTRQIAQFIASLGILLASVGISAQAAVDIKGARFDETYQLGNQALSLNGVGIRVKVIVDVYAAGLYLPRKEASASGILAMPGAKSMQIVLLRNLSGEDFADAMIKGFRKNHSSAEIARFQPKLDEIKGLMLAFGEVKKGAVIHIDHQPGSGTFVLVNGERKGPVIVGDDFYAALLKIWLGEHPVDDDLKAALLGGK
jgi:hypothetical protein